MLRIKNLQVRVEGKKILRGVTLTVKPGEVHALMGPNGSGKSTLAYTLMGHPKYKIDNGKLTMDKKDLLKMTPDKRAKTGLFLAFQYPVVVEGVTPEQLLRKAVQEIRPQKSEFRGSKGGMDVVAFRSFLVKLAKLLGIKDELLTRSLNEGFSGGEKKRMEILQLLTLKPSVAILDETDSGLDIDALKIVARGVKQAMSENPKLGVLVITHYQRLLDFLEPDYVHVLVDGKIVASGDKKVALTLEKKGYGSWLTKGKKQ